VRRDTEPHEPTGDALEAILRGTSEAMDYPPTPQVARRARERLERRPTAGLSVRRRLVGWLRGRGTTSPDRGRSVAPWAWSGAAVAVLAVVLLGWRLVLPSLSEPTVGGMLQAPAAAPAARSEGGRNQVQSQDQPANAPTPAAPAAPDSRAVGGPAANVPSSAADQTAAASAGAAGGVAAAPAAPSAAAAPVAQSAPAAAATARAAAVPAGPPAAPETTSRLAPAAPAPRPGPLDSASSARRQASALPLADAAARLGFTPLGPVALGAPAAVAVDDEDASPRVVLRWNARPASPEGQEALPAIVLTEGVAASDAGSASSGEPVVWAGGQGQWQAHAADAGGTLTWSSGGLTFRLESSLPADRAAALAAALAPLLP
jgi:hypothetical protein